MIGTAIDIYRATRKKHDLLFNVYMMRPIATMKMKRLRRVIWFGVAGVLATTATTPAAIGRIM